MRKMTMKFSDYTIDQQKAITSKGKNIIVSAGAGSGKTQVLTERVIYFIEHEGYKISDFLILTFTKLAEGEMKARIRKALTEKNIPDANNVDTADISTFDSYALSLVKKYHFLLNLPANISIIDTNIINVRKRTIINDLFDEYYEKEDEEFLKIIKRFCFRDDKNVQELVLKFYELMLLDNNSDCFIDEFEEKYFSKEFIDKLLVDFFNLLNSEMKKYLDLIPLFPKVPFRKDNINTYHDEVVELFSGFKHVNDYDDLVNKIVQFSKKDSKLRLNEKIPFGTKKLVTSFWEDFKKFQIKVATYPSTKEEFYSYFNDNLPVCRKIIEIIKKLHNKVMEYKKSHQVYEFSDIAKFSLMLVEKHKDICESIKNSLKMIMIDEYQDTSSLQDSFVSLIGNNNIYMVGDIKQSIYRFRNARCDIFIDKYNRYKNLGEGIAIDLNTNFRSRKEVLNDINLIFSTLMIDGKGGANYEKDHIIKFGNKDFLKAKDINNDYHIEFLPFLDKLNPKTKILAYNEADIIARDIISKINNHYQVMDKTKDKKPCLRDVKFSDFTILMDRGTEFETYREVFKNYHLPLFVENDENISSNEVVLVMTNILKLIRAIKVNDYSSPGFIHPFLSVARSFIGNYSDAELYEITINNSYCSNDLFVKIKDVVDSCSNLSISELFMKILFALDVYHKCITIGNIEKNTKYLDTFLELFKTMSSLDYSIDDFISYMELVNTYSLKINLSSSGSDVDSVKIMNIHKSKGLEFNIVYYSGLKKSFNLIQTKEDFNVVENLGLITPCSNVNRTAPLKVLYKNKETNEDLEEKIRLFYVALTRCKEKIIITIPDDSLIKDLSCVWANEGTDVINRLKLRTLPQEKAIEKAFEEYCNTDLCKNSFVYIAKFLDFKLPQNFFLLKENVSKNLKFSTLLGWCNDEVEIKEEEANEVTKFLYTLNTSMNDVKVLSVKTFEFLKENKISKNIFLNVLKLYDLKLNTVFYQQFDQNINDNDVFYLNNNYFNNIQFNQKTMLTTEMLDFKAIKQIDCFKFIPLYTEYVFNTIIFNDNESLVHDFLLITGIEIDEEVAKTITKKDNYLECLDIIKNPTYSYNLNETFKAYIDNINQFCKENKINETNICSLLSVYNDSFYKSLVDLVYRAIKLLASNDIVVSYFYKLLRMVGIEFSQDGRQYINLLVKRNVSKSVIIDSLNFNLSKYILFKDEFYENANSFIKSDFRKILVQIFKDFQQKYIDINQLNHLTNSLGFNSYSILFDYSFENLSSLKEDEFLELFDNRFEIKEFEKCKSLKDFVVPFYGYYKFKNVILNASKVIKLNQFKENNIVHENMNIKNLDIKFEKIEVFHPSKELNIDVNKKYMDFGTKIHEVMEFIDFKNPDFSSIIEPVYINAVKRFLNSDLAKNIKNGDIYKEYEYYDSENEVNGIIDLMIVYNDHIDIIDYKTKNISDSSYIKQIALYKEYISRKFNKMTNGYLYSLLNGASKQVD